ncbi:hypothetical protein E2C01_017408 [Portunus trituberculatus]|uniref:Uncharacterized protein n=1 Tax=Portunus trituberculatus TaxID=210409 RepID=A0A5B7DTC4_PORTR|nr:hypothetical protein [Portunus trituberculatus]
MPQYPSSSASGGKRHERDPMEGNAKTQLPATCASQQSVIGLSYVNNAPVSPSGNGNLDWLSNLLSVLTDKLHKPTDPPMSSGTNFKGFPDFSPSEDEVAEASRVPA